MKKYFFLLLLPLCMGLMACGDDDDDNDNGGDIKIEKLYGLWEMSHAQGYVVDDDGRRTTFNVDVNTTPKVVEAIEELDVFDIVRFEFKSGNKFIGYEYNSGKEEWRQYADNTFSLKGNQLTLGVDTSRPETVTIKSLTDNQFVYYMKDGEVDVTVTFKKIK